ncbi:MAG: glycosyltransferase family 2 protein [Lachnospiraceae bacterium]|nr:glycosyltransferase family 2 protein [Lachnospiraceae bacterium]
MTFELLVSCVKKDPHELATQMNIASDAVIVSQLEEKDSEETFELAGNVVRAIKSATRGVGLNRNICIENSTADVILFSDEDIVYEKEYAYTVMREFDAHPEADILLFNVKVCDERRTYWNEDFRQVKWYNCGRYPAYSIAARASALKMSGVKFSLLFGGGAKYSNGEDSLFLSDCLKAGLKLYATPVCIGEEIPRPSTWFNGYNDKFFYDRGVLYLFLYGKTAKLWGYRWLLKMKPQYSGDITFDKAKRLLFLGIADGDDVDREFDEEGNMTDTDGN